MPRAIFTNNARTTLAAGISAAATAITVVDGSAFPSPSAGDWAYLTLEYGADVEIVKLTARSGNNLTVQRAQDGTTAKSFTTAATVSLRLTKAVLDEIHADIAAAALTAAWGSISGKPSTFAPSAHTHPISDITGLQTALDGTVKTSGNQGISGTKTFGENIFVSRGAGIDKGLYCLTAGSYRWAVVGNGTPETGSNAGTNFVIARFSDAGAYLDAPLQIFRNSGQAHFTQTPVVAGNSVWHAGNFGKTQIDALNINADTVDGRHVGTSGNAIPALNATNTWSGAQVFNNTLSFSAADTSTARRLWFQTNGSARWGLIASNEGESGGNVGTDLYLNRYGDTGTFISSVMKIPRATGVVSFAVAPTVGTAPVYYSGNFGKTQIDALNINADTVDGKHVGTSGDAIPALNVPNTWGDWQQISTTGSLPFRLIRTGSSGGVGTRYTNASGSVDIFGVPTGSQAGSFIPGGDNSVDLGSSTNGWKDGYFGGVVLAGVPTASGVSGTLSRASHANRMLRLTGNITFPTGFREGDMGVFSMDGTARTITRGSGLAMYVNGSDVASATMAARGSVGYRVVGATGTAVYLSGDVS